MLNVKATGTFADKNVGTAKTVTLTSSYSGADVGNYSITDQASSTASISPVTTTSQPAQYAINGGGLNSRNYVFTQAADNASALTLKPGTPPEPVLSATTQLASNVFSPQADTRPGVLNLSPTITVTQSTGAGGDDAPAPSSNNNSGTATVVNFVMTIGSAGPALQIVNGGVNLSGNTVNE